MPALPAIPPSGENKCQGSYLTYSSLSLYATRRYLLAGTRQHSSKNRKSLSQRSLWIAPICAREQSKALMPMTALQSHASCFTPKIAPARPRWGSHSTCSCADEEEPLEAVLGAWVARERGKALQISPPLAGSFPSSHLTRLCQHLHPESAALPVWSVQKQICQQQWSTIAWHVFPKKEITLAFDFQRQPADALGKKIHSPFSPCLCVISFHLCYG